MDGRERDRETEREEPKEEEAVSWTKHWGHLPGLIFSFPLGRILEVKWKLPRFHWQREAFLCKTYMVLQMKGHFLSFLKILMFCLAHIFWYFHFLILSYNVIYLDVLDLVPFNISYSREVLSNFSPILTQEIASEYCCQLPWWQGKYTNVPLLVRLPSVTFYNRFPGLFNH